MRFSTIKQCECDFYNFNQNLFFENLQLRLVPKEMETIMKHLSQVHYHQIPDYELLIREFNVSYKYSIIWVAFLKLKMN